MLTLNFDGSKSFAGEAHHWLLCSCGSRLTPVFNYQGRTIAIVLVGDFFGLVERGRFICPHCGQIKRFVSVPV